MSEHEDQWLTDHGAQMVSTLGVQEGSSVIYFGCGKGRYSIPLFQVVGADGSVLAVERDAEEVAILRQRMAEFAESGSLRILHAEDTRLQSVEDATIDAVFAFGLPM